MSLVFCATGFSTGVWASQIPRIKEALALSNSALATVVLSFAVGAIATMPLTGALVTRFGGVHTVRATGIAAALSLVLLGASGSFTALLAATLCAGAAIGGLDVAMNTQATVIERAWGSPIMSGVHGWFSFGGLCGAAAGGALIGAAIGFRDVLWLTALLALISIGLVSGRLGVAGQSTGGPGFALPRRAVLGIGLLCLCALLFEGAVFDWAAVYMHDVAGASLGLAAAAFAGFSLSMAVMRFAGDAFTRRFGPVRVLSAGAALAACGIGLAVALPDPIAVTAGLTLAGFGQANIVPLLFSAAGRVPGISPGAGVAMAATLGYGAFLLGPPVIGFLADVVGLRSALLVLVMAALAIAVSGRVIRPNRPRGA